MERLLGSLDHESAPVMQLLCPSLLPFFSFSSFLLLYYLTGRGAGWSLESGARIETGSALLRPSSPCPVHALCVPARSACLQWSAITAEFRLFVAVRRLVIQPEMRIVRISTLHLDL